MMDDVTIFEIFNGREELIYLKNNGKVRIVYVDEKKRIECYYDRYGKETSLICYSPEGKVIFNRSIVNPRQYISRLYEDSQIIRIWNECY
jgi:hypothetical protein